MKCPVDDEVLQISEREGVEIDWCPSCRGVWLDRGELDKIIDRTNREIEAAPPPPRPERLERDDDYRPRDDDYRPRDGDYRPRDDDYRYRSRRKKSFLSEMFDFD